MGKLKQYSAKAYQPKGPPVARGTRAGPHQSPYQTFSDIKESQAMISREMLQHQQKLQQREADNARQSSAVQARRRMMNAPSLTEHARFDVVEGPPQSAAAARDLMIRRGGR